MNKYKALDALAALILADRKYEALPCRVREEVYRKAAERVYELMMRDQLTTQDFEYLYNETSGYMEH